MFPKYHIIFSVIISIFLYFLNLDLLFVLLFFFSSILIDVDHYFLYIIKKKSFNPIKAYKYFKNKLNGKNKKYQKPRIQLFIFHTIEFFILLLILSFFFNFLWPILFGCLFHESVDLIYALFKKHRKYKKANSIILYIKK